jgi:taurine--2-oxoglutarate transaminase
MTRITKACIERGLYSFAHWNVLAVTPPLTITREELDEGLEIFDEVLAIADEYAST